MTRGSEEPMLGFTLNDEQEAFRGAVRGFAERSLAPRVEELERTETFPLDLFRELGRLGYLGVGYPEEYGGSGGDMVMRCLLIEEIARVNCGFAAALLAHVGLGCIPLLRFGTDAQKREYLVPALRGEKLGCWALSEPNAGSDAASIRTTAVKQGDDYVINGSKMFITNGNIADYCLIAAYTDRTRRGTGISTFVVDTKTPGFHVSRKLRKTGHHTSETAALTFEELRVPASALLGGVEGGFKQVTGTLEGGRITHAARSVGVSQAALEAALGYAREREQFGQKISKFQAIKFKLARMAMEVETARTAMWRAAWLFDQGPCMREAAMAKLFASEVAQRITWEAMQIHGGYGYITEFPVERFWRDARLMTITEGTTEIQLTIIARELGL
jgi:alkylation response protein AidB-like acyl-CoA dehydrogenase